MKDNHYYKAYDHDRLKEGEKLVIERNIYLNDDLVDISELIKQPESLPALIQVSQDYEQLLYSELGEMTNKWEKQAANTLILKKALEYTRTRPIVHTENQWTKDEYGVERISNMVYFFNCSIYEHTRWKDGKEVPVSCSVTWSVGYQSFNQTSHLKIDGQYRKKFKDKESAVKYLDGRKKKYMYLFQKISPPIPDDYSDIFKIGGCLLPGYQTESDMIHSLERDTKPSGKGKARDGR